MITFINTMSGILCLCFLPVMFSQCVPCTFTVDTLLSSASTARLHELLHALRSNNDFLVLEAPFVNGTTVILLCCVCGNDSRVVLPHRFCADACRVVLAQHAAWHEVWCACICAQTLQLECVMYVAVCHGLFRLQAWARRCEFLHCTHQRDAVPEPGGSVKRRRRHLDSIAANVDTARAEQMKLLLALTDSSHATTICTFL
jgi:hypothetical protein